MVSGAGWGKGAREGWERGACRGWGREVHTSAWASVNGVGNLNDEGESLAE